VDSWRYWKNKKFREKYRQCVGKTIGITKIYEKDNRAYLLVKLTGFEYPRQLSTMTDEEAARDGAQTGETAKEWQSRKENKGYFSKTTQDHCRLSWEYVGVRIQYTHNTHNTYAHTHVQQNTKEGTHTHTYTTADWIADAGRRGGKRGGGAGAYGTTR